MRGHDDETSHVPKHWLDAVRPLGQTPCHAVHENPVEPSLQDRGLSRPPRRVHEDERLAPAQVLDVTDKFGMSFELRGEITGVRETLIDGEDRIESFSPQVAMTYFVCPGGEFGENDIAQMTNK